MKRIHREAVTVIGAGLATGAAVLAIGSMLGKDSQHEKVDPNTAITQRITRVIDAAGKNALKTTTDTASYADVSCYPDYCDERIAEQFFTNKAFEKSGKNGKKAVFGGVLFADIHKNKQTGAFDPNTTYALQANYIACPANTALADCGTKVIGKELDRIIFVREPSIYPGDNPRWEITFAHPGSVKPDQFVTYHDTAQVDKALRIVTDITQAPVVPAR